MTKKELTVVIGIMIVIIALIVFLVNKNKVNGKVEEVNFQNTVRLEYDENNGKYLVYDEIGKEIYNGTNRAEAEFRERHPDFNPGFEDVDQNMIPVGATVEGQF